MVFISSQKSPVICKSYFLLDTESGMSSEFKQPTYQKLDKSNNITIIHYIGDHTVAAPFPHRNSTKYSQRHLRTCPSYITKIKEECKITMYISQELFTKRKSAIKIQMIQSFSMKCPKILKQLQNL